MERRNRRSPNPSVALGYYLESLAARHAWTAAALADDDGLLLGGASRHIDLEAVAAVAPLVAREGAATAPDGFLGLVTRGQPLSVWPVEVQGGRMHLAAVGPAAAPTADAARAIGRILSERAA